MAEIDYEKFARLLVVNGGADPDQLVEIGQPRVYGTAVGPAFAVVPGNAVPLWTLYEPAARLACEVILGAGMQLNTPFVTHVAKPDDGMAALDARITEKIAAAQRLGNAIAS